MQRYLFFFFTLAFCAIFAQQDKVMLSKTALSDSLTTVDPNYREDQFYISVTYNLLGNKVSNVTQNGFSSGLHLGFIRDFPINVKRNLAIGIGLGVSANAYNQNLLISKSASSYEYTVLEGRTFSRNRFSTYLLEVPLEFRWRTSTATEFDFWRIYTGFKFGWLLYNTSKYRGSPSDISLTNSSDFNTIQYGLTLSVGYSNVNVHVYYGLNTIFDKDTTVTATGERIEMKSIKVGLMFYIL